MRGELRKHYDTEHSALISESREANRLTGEVELSRLPVTPIVLTHGLLSGNGVGVSQFVSDWLPSLSTSTSTFAATLTFGSSRSRSSTAQQQQVKLPVALAIGPAHISPFIAASSFQAPSSLSSSSTQQKFHLSNKSAFVSV